MERRKVGRGKWGEKIRVRKVGRGNWGMKSGARKVGSRKVEPRKVGQ